MKFPFSIEQFFAADTWGVAECISRPDLPDARCGTARTGKGNLRP